MPTVALTVDCKAAHHDRCYTASLIDIAEKLFVPIHMIAHSDADHFPIRAGIHNRLDIGKALIQVRMQSLVCRYGNFQHFTIAFLQKIFGGRMVRLRWTAGPIFEHLVFASRYR